MSNAKAFWKDSEVPIDLVVCDGTFTKLRDFQHIIFIAVMFDGNDNVIITSGNPIDITMSGDYSVSITDNTGCEGTATITVDPIDPVSITAPDLSNICYNDALEFDLSVFDVDGGAGTVTWYEGNPTDGNNIADISIVNLADF